MLARRLRWLMLCRLAALAIPLVVLGVVLLELTLRAMEGER